MMYIEIHPLCAFLNMQKQSLLIGCVQHETLQEGVWLRENIKAWQLVKIRGLAGSVGGERCPHHWSWILLFLMNKTSNKSPDSGKDRNGLFCVIVNNHCSIRKWSCDDRLPERSHQFQFSWPLLEKTKKKLIKPKNPLKLGLHMIDIGFFKNRRTQEA